MTLLGDCLPVIDFRGFHDGGGKAALAAALTRACEEVGFFYLSGHGVPQALCDEGLAQTKRFFDQAAAEKNALHISKSPVHRGYFPVFEEATDPGMGRGDLKEGFDLARDLPPDDPAVRAGKPLHGPNVWPENLPGFRPAIEAYFAEMRRLAEDLMAGFALGLGLEEDFFADKIDQPLAQLRLLHYPPQAATPEAETIGCGTHSDYGCLTILNQDDKGGLIVRARSGGWIEVPPLPGAFVVNIGDQMARWTNGRFAATPHRVINRSGQERYSMPFFFDPNFDTLVECLPGCLLPGQNPRFAPVLAGEYLIGRYNDTFAYRKT